MQQFCRLCRPVWSFGPAALHCCLVLLLFALCCCGVRICLPLRASWQRLFPGHPFAPLGHALPLSSPADPRTGCCSSRKILVAPEAGGIRKGFYSHFYPHGTPCLAASTCCSHHFQSSGKWGVVSGPAHLGSVAWLWGWTKSPKGMVVAVRGWR